MSFPNNLLRIVFVLSVASSNSVSRADEELAASLRQAGRANAQAHRNFDVSFRHWFHFSAPEPFNAKIHDHEWDISTRLIIDYENQRCDLYRLTIGKPNPPTKEVEATPDLEGIRANNERWLVGSTVEAFSFSKGEFVWWSGSNPPTRHDRTFPEFLERQKIPRVEMAALTRFPSYNGKTTTEIFADIDRSSIKTPDPSTKVFEDGSIQISREFEGGRTSLRFAAGQFLPEKDLYARIKDGQPEVAAEYTRTYIEKSSVTLPIHMNYTQENVTRARPADNMGLALEEVGTVDFHWHQVNSEQLEFPEFEKVTQNRLEFEKFLKSGFQE